MNLGIDGHVAIVTGAGRGIGAGISDALAQEGATVVCLDRDESAFEQAACVEQRGGKATGVVVDITDSAAVDAAITSLRAELGHLEVLVNCAGFSRDSPIADMSDETWQSVLDVNLNGAFYLARAVVPAMRHQRYGRIVNISSRAWRGEDLKANYAAAKAGLVGLTGALAIELGKSNITVNAIAPGYVETERLKALSHHVAIHDRALALTYTPRLGTPDDVAAAVLYLCSTSAGYVTGEVLAVAGGRLR